MHSTALAVAASQLHLQTTTRRTRHADKRSDYFRLCRCDPDRDVGDARACAGQPMDSRTEFTFNQPVELPGVTLPPGTYIFRFVDATTGRKVMQVQAKDASSKNYGMFMTISAQRPQAVGQCRASIPRNACRPAGRGEDMVVSGQHDRPRVHLSEVAGSPACAGDQSDGADDAGRERDATIRCRAPIWRMCRRAARKRR